MTAAELPMDREPAGEPRPARTPTERKPGDFKRNAKGTPSVSDPTGATVKSGDRKGQVKWVTYSRPSSIGKLISDTTNLERRSERGIVLGLMEDADLRARLEHAHAGDVDGIAAQAKEAAGLNLAADRGTHVHYLTEAADKGQSWRHLDDDGLALGITPEMADAIVGAWRTFLSTHGLTVLVVEATVVNDDVRAAGTLDRLVRPWRPLTFGVATVPPGPDVVLDIKTGRWGVDEGYWQTYPAQLAAYAGSVPYDCTTDTRGEWSWPISQEHGLIAHLGLAAVIDGHPPVWTLVHVDLRAGFDALALVKAAKDYGTRRDLFTVADETPAGEVVPVAATHDPAGQAGALIGDSAPAALAPKERGDQLRAMPDRPLDEGEAADPTEVAQAEAVFRRLIATNAAAASWIRALNEQGRRNLVSFHVGENPTQRRLSIVRGLIRLAVGGADDNEALRSLVALAVGADWPLFANVEPGHVLGAMTAAEAATFAEHADALASGSLVATADDGGTLRFAPAA